MDYSYVLTSYVVEFTFTAFQIAAWYRRREQTNCVRPRRHHRYGSGCLKRRSTELTQLDVRKLHVRENLRVQSEAEP